MRPLLRTVVATVLLLAALLGGAACDAPTAPGVPVRIEVVGDSLLSVGDTVRFRAVGYDEAGQRVPLPTVTWTVLDELVASVSAGGEASGERAGETGIVATAGELADTARVRVYWPDLSLNEARGVLVGPDTVDFLWRGLVKVNDVLGTTEGDRTTLVVEAEQLDSAIVLRIPAVLSTGVHRIEAYPLDGAEMTGGNALVVLPGPAGERVYYSVGGGSLVVEAADYPPRPGLYSGSTRARLSFRATRYLTGPDGRPVPSGDTIAVSAETHLHLQHLLAPYARLDVEGGHLTGSSLRTHAQAVDDQGGMLIWWESDFDGMPHQLPWEISHALWLRSPAEGEHTVDALTPGVYADPDAWPPVFSVLYYRDYGEAGLSRSGTATITRVLLPTDAYYGEIHGSLQATLELWHPDGTAAGEEVRATAVFAVPIHPRGGVPN